MSTPTDQLEELQKAFQGAEKLEEAGKAYIFIPGLQLPAGCSPPKVDALLCPTELDGYSSRLFFAERVQTSKSPNWNGNVWILERNWHACSWKTRAGARLIQMVAAHLEAL
jgi:hypothetical protein